MPLLTKREKAVIPYLALPMKIAAYELGVHESTVKVQIISLQNKLGVTSRYGLVATLAAAGYPMKIMTKAGVTLLDRSKTLEPAE